jgi:hypothetical protein
VLQFLIHFRAIRRIPAGAKINAAVRLTLTDFIAQSDAELTEE